MNRFKCTMLITALAAASLAAAGCEQRGQDNATRTGDASSSSSVMGKSSQPGMMGKSDITAQSSQPDSAAQPAQAQQSPSEKLVTAADDTAITAKIKASMLAEPGLKSTQINVDTKNATVTLSGTVDSDTIRDRAKQIAMSTEGVRNVVDNLNLKNAS